jgi:DNA repair protein RadD
VEDTQWGRVMQRYPQALGLIVTASPERLDGRGLGQGQGGFADTMIVAPGMAWAIEQGFLSPYRVFTAPQQLDLSGVHTRMGDYVSSEVAEKVDKPHVTGDAIAHWQRHARGTRTVVFCVSVEHSKHVADEFNLAGIPAAHIDGGLDDAERDRAIVDFAEGRVLVLCNVNLVSEGFDLASIAQKDVTIDAIIDLAPTQSLVNAMQRWGRALRPAPGKTAVILDHAGNVLRHGLPDDDREWSLEGRKRGRRAANDNAPDVPVKTCKKCYAIHRPAPVCPMCGYEYPAQDRKVEQREGNLAEITREQVDAERRQRLMQQGKAQTVADLMAQGISMGRAVKILAAREEKTRLREAVQRARPDIPLRVMLAMKPKELRAALAA